MDNVLTEIEKAYLAGFFDGEGCINISSMQHPHCRNLHYYLQVVITQTDYDVLKTWRDKVGLGKIYEHKVNKYKTKLTGPFKLTWQWRIPSRQAGQFLQILLPYLIIKKDQAEIAIKFRKTKVHYGSAGTPRSVMALREQYKQTLKTLKKGCGARPAVESPELENDPQLELPLGLN